MFSIVIKTRCFHADKETVVSYPKEYPLNYEEFFDMPINEIFEKAKEYINKYYDLDKEFVIEIRPVLDITEETERD